MTMTVTILPKLPPCCRCEMQGAIQTGNVRYDSPVTTLGGSWGYLCHSHLTYEGNRKMASKIVTK